MEIKTYEDIIVEMVEKNVDPNPPHDPLGCDVDSRNKVYQFLDRIPTDQLRKAIARLGLKAPQPEYQKDAAWLYPKWVGSKDERVRRILNHWLHANFTKLQLAECKKGELKSKIEQNADTIAGLLDKQDRLVEIYSDLLDEIRQLKREEKNEQRDA